MPCAVCRAQAQKFGLLDAEQARVAQALCFPDGVPTNSRGYTARGSGNNTLEAKL